MWSLLTFWKPSTNDKRNFTIALPDVIINVNDNITIVICRSWYYGFQFNVTIEIANSKCSAESVPGRIICGSHHLCWLLAGRNIPTMRNKAAPRGSFYPPPPPSPLINMQPVQLTWRQPSSVCRWAAGTHGGQPGSRQRKQRPGTNDCFNFARNNFTIYDCWCWVGLGAAPTKAVRYIESRDITAGAEWWSNRASNEGPDEGS